ncbi:hypothetical protein [Psychrobacillus vulpis]|uniref:Lipoprotein n=1 Tax=Psychrobacillus vulpis TaxID=2325572 RepID=A0A544TNL0_9BACI|nr:hypothetical protein [Psychrobacillus vulpis]TQR18999.1 hypothetical protein FG384_14345 [Psychrobacillus vulpis]
MIGNSKPKSIFLLLMITFIMTGCISKEDRSILEKAKGDGLTYSEYFKSVDELDHRQNVIYYKPLPIDKMLALVPESMKKSVHLVNSKKLPFEVNEQTAYVVTSKDEQGNLQNQLQLTYLNNSEYGQPEEFLIISVTEVDENPLEKYDFSKEKTDTVGNEIKKEILTDEIPIFHQVINTNGGLAYRYYMYNEKEERVGTMVTSANELYSYYNGHLYHVGYWVENQNTKGVQEEILQVTKEFILSK